MDEGGAKVSRGGPTGDFEDCVSEVGAKSGGAGEGTGSNSTTTSSSAGVFSASDSGPEVGDRAVGAPGGITGEKSGPVAGAIQTAWQRAEVAVADTRDCSVEVVDHAEAEIDGTEVDSAKDGFIEISVDERDSPLAPLEAVTDLRRMPSICVGGAKMALRPKAHPRRAP